MLPDRLERRISVEKTKMAAYHLEQKIVNENIKQMDDSDSIHRQVSCTTVLVDAFSIALMGIICVFWCLEPQVRVKKSTKKVRWRIVNNV